MCMSCSDFVDYCSQGDCYNPNGGPFGYIRKFYIGDLYCEHLQKLYGHTHATSDEWENEDNA
jgi:hypothetical protein